MTCSNLSSALALVLVLLALAPVSAQSPTPSTISVVHHVVTRATAAANVDALIASLAADEITATRTGPESVSVTMLVAPRALDVAAALGLGHACILSPDVHQTTWALYDCEPIAGMPDRLASRAARAGIWDLVPRVHERPRGRLPALVSGASPAYPVRAGSRVDSIDVRIRH